MRIKNLYLSAISLVLAIIVFVMSGLLIKNDAHGMGIAGIVVGVAMIAVAAIALLNFILGKKDGFMLIPLLALFVTLAVFSGVATINLSASSSTTSDTSILQLMLFALSAVSLVFATKNKKWANICGVVVTLISIYSSAALLITCWGENISNDSANAIIKVSAYLSAILLMSYLVFLFFYTFNLVFNFKKVEANKETKNTSTEQVDAKEVTSEVKEEPKPIENTNEEAEKTTNEQ